jgi:hypothetical protein
MYFSRYERFLDDLFTYLGIKGKITFKTIDMKNLVLYLSGIFVFLMTACGQQNTSPTSKTTSGIMVANEVGTSSSKTAVSQGNASAANSSKIVFHSVKSSNPNEDFGLMPLPADWKIVAGQPSITGPNGIKVFDQQGGFWSYSNDTYTQQLYQSTGQPMRRPIGAANVVTQDLAPKMQSQGLKFIKQYPLPEVAKANQAYSSLLFKAVPAQETFEAVGSEWEDINGNIKLVVIHYSTNAANGTVFWSYYMNVLGAPKAHFEEAKKTYINGLVGFQYNPAQIISYNKSEAQKANQSWAIHNDKMARNQANFEAAQQNHKDKWDAINKSSMDAYHARDAASDKNQHDFLNTIKEENTVYNSTTGKTYQVEAGSNYYWMNSNGEYIKSNDPSYNPNSDPSTYNVKWEQVKVQK